MVLAEVKRVNWNTNCSAGLRKPQHRAKHFRMGERGDRHPESLEHALEHVCVKIEISRSGVARFCGDAWRVGIE